MKNIVGVDKNFKVESNVAKDDIQLYNVLQPPFKLYGVFYENGMFRRLPENVAESISEGIAFLHTNTAGGRVRFKTSSSYIAVISKMSGVSKMPHFALTGSSGFDMYVKEKDGEVYRGTFLPPYDIEDGYESIIEFESEEVREITINFPLYSDVRELHIGISKNAELTEADDYITGRLIVYYGSSITQGGCASRPGNSYQSIISRRFDCDYINLGFSGSAKGEKEIADYIKSLDMSLFIYDYDHNAPTEQYLSDTHERMFKTIRAVKPNLPIIIMSRPKFYLDKYEEERLSIIEATYRNAVDSGDENVYFISGSELMRLAKSDGTVDNVHPNDFGFASMAQALGDFIEKNKLL